MLLVLSSLFLSVLIGVLLSRRGASNSAAMGSAQRQPTIGLSFDTLKEERWQRDRAAFIARAQALGARVIDLAANSNDIQQVHDVESLITSRVDVLVIVPHDGAAMAKAVGLAHAANISVIAYDRLIPNCDLDFYISFDAKKVGALQARYLIDHLHLPAKGPGQIIRLHGAKTDHNAHLIKQGQDQVLQPLLTAAKLVVAHEDWVDEWKPEQAKRIVNAALTRVAQNDGVSGIVGILAPNDGTAGGAAQALLEEGLWAMPAASANSPSIVLTGQDAELTACQRILAGTQTMTVYKPLSQLAHRAAEVAVAMATGKPIIATAEVDNGRRQVPSIFVDVIAVDRQNLLNTVVKDGFHSQAALQAPGN